MLNDQPLLPVCSRKQMMRYFVEYLYTTKRMFFIRTYLRGQKSFTPSVLELITSLFCKTSDLNERNFIVRCLYEDCYWLLFPQCGSHIYVCLLVYMSLLYAVTVILCVYQCDSIKKTSVSLSIDFRHKLAKNENGTVRWNERMLSYAIQSQKMFLCTSEQQRCLLLDKNQHKSHRWMISH